MDYFCISEGFRTKCLKKFSEKDIKIVHHMFDNT